MQQTYEQQLAAALAEAQKRVMDGVAAGNFMETPEGKLIQDWINEKVSYEMERMTAKSALGDREYLEVHGAVRVLKDFNIMLQSKAADVASATEEVESISGQQESIAK